MAPLKRAEKPVFHPAAAALEVLYRSTLPPVAVYKVPRPPVDSCKKETVVSHHLRRMRNNSNDKNRRRMSPQRIPSVQQLSIRNALDSFLFLNGRNGGAHWIINAKIAIEILSREIPPFLPPARYSERDFLTLQTAGTWNSSWDHRRRRPVLFFSFIILGHETWKCVRSLSNKEDWECFLFPAQCLNDVTGIEPVSLPLRTRPEPDRSILSPFWFLYTSNTNNRDQGANQLEYWSKEKRKLFFASSPFE